MPPHCWRRGEGSRIQLEQHRPHPNSGSEPRHCEHPDQHEDVVTNATSNGKEEEKADSAEQRHSEDAGARQSVTPESVATKHRWRDG